jgi:5-methylthioadenosine/S-adenosylhomocysteine deaminase
MLVPPLGHDRHPRARRGGLLDSNVIAAHCVKADEEEIALLAEHDVAVATARARTRILGCGVAPLTALREAGIRVCIATDSPASTPSFDMFDEMRAAILGARARDGRPDALTARMRSSSQPSAAPARSGSTESRGSIVVGKQADLTSSRWRTRPSSRGKILLREPFSEDLLRASSLLSCPATAV